MRNLRNIAGIAGIVAVLAVVLVLKRCEDELGSVSTPHGTPVNQTDTTIEPENASEKIVWQPTPEEQKVIDETEAVFHGKVVDQHGEPVPGVEVVIIPKREPWGTNLRRRTTQADESGLFTFRESECPWASVGITPPPGYYNNKQSSGVFGFAEIPPSVPEALRRGIHGVTRTSLESPHVFVLKKMASRDPLLERAAGGHLKETQTCRLGTKPDHQLEVTYWFDSEVKRMHANGWPVHDWGIEIKVVNGGLAEAKRPETSNSEEYVAPEGGYRPGLRFAFDSSMRDEELDFNVDTHFFVRFSDGTYARVEAHFTSGVKRPWWNLNSWYNPSGGGSLEYDPTMRIKEPQR